MALNRSHGDQIRDRYYFLEYGVAVLGAVLSCVALNRPRSDHDKLTYPEQRLRRV